MKIVLFSRIDPGTISTLKCDYDLRLIIRAGSGFDNIDVDAARCYDIRVVRIPDLAGHLLARGGVVDEDALFDSLQSDSGLAGSAIESQAEIGGRILEFIDAHLAGTLSDVVKPVELVA